MISALFFYLFAAVLIGSAFMVITVRNPVHAVLFLILAFFNAAGLFVLLSAEFLAMILVVVYVGAVMVLFLFVVMMLDVDFAELKAGFLRYLPVGVAVGAIMALELIFVVTAWITAPETIATVPAQAEDVTNTLALGRILYTDYVYLFEAASLILLVAMIGAIVLTLHHKEGVRRQKPADQVARDPKKAIEVVKVQSGRGLS
ncbi:NADH-quinone oxidoreductase subunit J [Methyloligella sp. 2.7D]|uniref:NADH-quinone oxidoreductase subunit J n=1 Tax=unclassified Methyloligella TaxID=2625955 RepID=UPI00157C5FB2|nr:NADH-quinone oxidoreductase subunit J [Methyloligella sp. GL2]QKP77541.1 NADH-quinone oxidoreductase subunit J [Methyloligella sp. GL2]